MTHATTWQRWSRTATTVMATMTVGVLLAACSGNGAVTSTTAPGTFKDGGTLTIALTGSSIGSLDPALANTLVSVSVIGNMCDPLYRGTVTGGTVPVLAVGEPDYNADRTAATIKLRPKVKFQDGTDMDAESVMQTIQRNQTLEGSQRKGDLRIIKKVEVVDASTLHFDFTGPVSDGAFQDAFESRGAYPVSPTAVAAEGANFAAAPVCVGGYTFTSQTTDTVTLTRETKDNYYDPSSLHLDSIVLKVVGDASVRFTNLQSGQFSVIQSLSPKDLETAKNNQEISVQQNPGRGYINLVINTDSVKDPLVRKALVESIDRKAITKTVWSDLYAPACSFIPPTNAMATPENTKCIEYDPAQAKKDLASAGVTTPVPLLLEYSANPEWTQIATLVQAMGEATGFKITLKPTDTATAIADTEAGSNDLYINQWTGGADPVSNIMLTKGAFENYHNWDNPKMNALVAEINKTTDPDALKALYGKVVAVVNDEIPVTYIAHNALILAAQKKVAGLELNQSNGIFAMHAGFTS